MAQAIIKHEQIITTLPKAQTMKPIIDKLITLGKKGNLISRRKALSILQDDKMTKKIFDILSERYKNRDGGYTRIIKLGNRLGDNASMAMIELVDFNDIYNSISSNESEVPVAESTPESTSE